VVTSVNKSSGHHAKARHRENVGHSYVVSERRNMTHLAIELVTTAVATVASMSSVVSANVTTPHRDEQ
jgi:hypothetical protein